MAKDAPSKLVSDNDPADTPPCNIDQQKVPPLRIVLNTSGNQKTPSTTLTVTAKQEQELKRDKSNDAKTDNPSNLKTGGRVRIKLGTNKPAGKASSGTSESASQGKSQEDAAKFKPSLDRQQDTFYKEESVATYSHLRRITRRSQRTVQTVSNEDEESISSMTSTDENQNTSNNNGNNNSSETNNSPDNPPQSVSQPVNTSGTTSTTTSTTTSHGTGISGVEAPRRYKRRKGESNEGCPIELYGPFSFQNYKLPIQNSFELFKNIRKQVDKKLDDLNSVHPKVPRGFRDYMLARGAYLLDGNRLGNGMNLFMNEDGGLYPVSGNRYHSLKQDRVNYSVPSRAKVPIDIPINSPLYSLFIEQEKERYRMRMQHIKEREKLTLAAEQEIVRVYNQASMNAVNQVEPLSACTMLKHQEIYNYMDNDGFMIQANDDSQQDETRQDDIRTSRRRPNEQASPAPARKVSSSEEASTAVATENSQDSADTVDPTSSTATDSQGDNESKVQKGTEEFRVINIDSVSVSCKVESPDDKKEGSNIGVKQHEKNVDNNSGDVSKMSESETLLTGKNELIDSEDENYSMKVEANETSDDTEVKNSESVSIHEEKRDISDVNDAPQAGQVTEEKIESSTEQAVEKDERLIVSMEEDKPEQETTSNGESGPSEDEKKANNRQQFLCQLQNVDDKWERIRCEMLIRHKNEAESLHAVQRLEWEWKTKEIGACDVRTTPIIDNVLVPKLSIYLQDY